MLNKNNTTKWNETSVNDVVTSREAENILKVSKDTLNRYCMRNIIPFTRPTMGKRYFLKSDLLKHISKKQF